MPFLPARSLPCASIRLLLIGVILLFPCDIFAQGSGRSSTGTDGSHIIKGYVFFPSGRRAEGSIQVKLQSYTSGELSAIADSNGAFTFTSLSPGNYTVMVIAGDDYEIASEVVYIDSDVRTSKTGPLPITSSRRYTVLITLQLKRSAANARTSVVNAALAEVPEKARTLYDKGLEQSVADQPLKAIDNLKAAISLYPKFPLALNELGVQYLKVKDPYRAVEPLRSAIKLSPEAFSPKLNLGIALLEMRQYAAAEMQLREALKQNESAPTAHMYLGVALTRLRNYSEAEKELRLAIESGGTRLGLAHYYLGGIYWGRGEYRRAADELEAYLRLTANAADAERVRTTIKELRSKS